MLSPAPVSLSQAAVFIAIYCTASLQLSWHLLEENKMDFAPLLHIYLTSILAHRTSFLSLTVGWWWASFNTSLIHLLFCSGICQPPCFWCKMHHFQAWIFHWNGLCLVHQISQQGREKSQMALQIRLYFVKSLFWKVEYLGPLGHSPCDYVEMVEEDELIDSGGFILFLLLQLRHVSNFSAVLSSLMTANVTHE